MNTIRTSLNVCRDNFWRGEIDIQIDPDDDLFRALAVGANLLARVAKCLRNKTALSTVSIDYPDNPIDFIVLDGLIRKREVSEIKERFKTGQLTTLSLSFSVKSEDGIIIPSSAQLTTREQVVD